MTLSSRDTPNPYASPTADETSEVVAASNLLPLNKEIWLATGLIWFTCFALGLAAGYVLLAWVTNKYPQVNLQIPEAAKLAQFATGAANALVMAALLAYGQYHAVIRRDMIWTRTLALLLVIASLVIALGSVLIFGGTGLMWLLLIPSAIASLLSLLMFRWYGQLSIFRRKTRRREQTKRSAFG
ncbi:hypothetical protein NA78x_004364 [Anatilimnocola sp. NA78]|uniref:hypothetical protein n=1 Tax=Anatilimnocola sp. NA78 TaxID=3415683 RepID=UPI003CE58D5E